MTLSASAYGPSESLPVKKTPTKPKATTKNQARTAMGSQHARAAGAAAAVGAEPDQKNLREASTTVKRDTAYGSILRSQRTRFMLSTGPASARSQ